MALASICELTKQPILFRLHRNGEGEDCPNGSIMPPKCGEHRHCGNSEAHPNCKLCTEINYLRKCMVCGQMVEIFSEFGDKINENIIEGDEVPEDKANWELNNPTIVISPEFVGLKINGSAWKKEIFGKIQSALLRAEIVKIVVFTEAHLDSIGRVIWNYNNGFLGKLMEDQGRFIDLVLWKMNR
ncbi:hypothetical protein N9Y75_05345 [Candidatus Poseidoniales archaeon]|nr:hypothetical protein [Candidatus Poseidoniales archaeon]MDB2672258.1 hypothetical protein [Candidatus Poseidoniales archaeon]